MTTDNVTYERQDYIRARPEWQMADDFCDGQRAVKERGQTYLPDPNMLSDDTDGKVYERYKQRACLFPVASRTLQSMIGAAFAKWPSMDAPPNLEYLESDADGSGVSVYQQSQSTASAVLRNGRAGLLVDFPQSDGQLTVADMQSGAILANILAYSAEQIINWRTERVGAINRLVLVILREVVHEPGEYGVTAVNQWRELRLIDGAYVVRLWRRNERSGLEMVSESFPRQSSGALWSEIPFAFVGAMNNDTEIDNAPMMDIVTMNLKHYQLAADWYNALFYAGQPQPTMTGLSESWRDWLTQNQVALGSRSMLPLPVGGDFKYVTVPADVALKAELTDLENRMVAVGARLLRPGEATMTATQARAEVAANHSVLSLVCENVSEAYTLALSWCQMFMGGASEIGFRIEMDNEPFSVDAQVLTAVVAANQAGKIPDSDLFRILKRWQLIDPAKTEEDIADELSNTVPRLPVAM